MRALIYSDQLINFSLLEIQRCLAQIALTVELITPETLDDDTAPSRFVKRLQEQELDVILYQYSPKSFAQVSDVLGSQSSKTIFYYDAPPSLNKVRRYGPDHYELLAREQERQKLSEWVQEHCEHAQWLAASMQSKRDLMNWRVRDVPEKLLIAPPFSVYQEGSYRQESDNSSQEDVPQTAEVKLLAMGRLAPENGVLDMLAAFHRFLNNQTPEQKAQTRLTWLLDATPGHSAYESDVRELIDRLSLAGHIEFVDCGQQIEPLNLNHYDAMISGHDHDEYFCPIRVEAQAIGLPVVVIPITDTDLCSHILNGKAQEKADTKPESIIFRAIAEPEYRRSLVVDGYKSIIQNHNQDTIRDHLLSHVATVLLRKRA